MAPKATPTPGKTLLDSKNHTLIMIDFQSQMAFATKSIDAVTLRNNAALVAESARIFNVPTILTTVAEKTFSGPMFDEIKASHPKSEVIDRTTMNTWEDGRIAERVNKIGKNRIVFAGLWTSVCIVGPALSALDQGFEVYVLADACGACCRVTSRSTVGPLAKITASGPQRLMTHLTVRSDHEVSR
jgi:nicotinamidase-related amidase